MVFVVLCLALMLAPWTIASPVHTPTVNIATAHKTRTKRCLDYYGSYYGYDSHNWPWCNNQYYHAQHPCYYYSCWGPWSLYPSATTKPSTTTTPSPYKPPFIIILPTNPSRPTRPPYIPIMPTQPGRPTIPPYIPIMPTLPGRPTRPPYIPIMPSKRPIRPFPYGRRMGRSLKERRGCNRVCVDEHKMHYCCDTTTTQPPTTLASRGTCPPQIYPCTLPANHTTQRDCESDHQCPDDHGCCYDHCLQEYKCRRLLPHTSTTTPAPRLSHRHENETRVKRSLQKDEEPAVVPETLAASETQPQMTTGRHGEEARLTVMVDEGRPGSGQRLQHLLQLLTRLQQPTLPILFLPLHPLADERRTVWEVVQCAAQAAPEQKAAVHLVSCVLAAPPPPMARLDSFLSSVRQCGRNHRVSWTSLQLCVDHGKERGMLRDALLRHARLLQAARTRQMTAAPPAAAVLAVNGTLVDGSLVLFPATTIVK